MAGWQGGRDTHLDDGVRVGQQLRTPRDGVARVYNEPAVGRHRQLQHVSLSEA